jgi:Fic family protein
MKYKHLTSLYYENEEQYKALYEKRFHSESCIHLPVSIAGNDAFFLYTPDITIMTETIMRCNSQLYAVLRKLPEEAVDMLKREIIIEEIMVTNDIEGVRSTRKEITDAMDASPRKDKKLRFQGLVNKYQKLLFQHEYTPLQNCNDIRQIYDEIVINEIASEDRPDGTIFRKESVSVRTITDKEIHKGIYPEESLISFMENALSILSMDSVSHLVAISAFHYLFGYAHPFYDGNGRTDRFISSMLLNQLVHPLIGSRLAYSIKNDKNQYQKCFDLCNDPKNKGDLTPFILFFLHVIVWSAKNMLQLAEELYTKFTHYDTVIRQIPNLEEQQKCVLLTLMQSALFGNCGVQIKELAHYLSKGPQTATKVLKTLLDRFPIQTIRLGTSKIYRLDLEQLEELCK